MGKESKSSDDESKPTVAKSALELQRFKLAKLMKNPDKPIVIPERLKEKKMPHVPEFVRNVMGSSAGAGSGEFHVYRHLRRKEYARQKFIQEKSEKQLLEEAYHQKLLDNQQAAEEKTAKKRAKRLKKRAKKKIKKYDDKNKKIEDDSSKDDTTSEEDSQNETNQEEKISEISKDTQLEENKNSAPVTNQTIFQNLLNSNEETIISVPAESNLTPKTNAADEKFEKEIQDKVDGSKVSTETEDSKKTTLYTQIFDNR